MSIADALDRPIAYHRCLVKLTGSVKGAVMLSQAIYWQKRAKQGDGWWYKTAEEWEEETGLTPHEQKSARKSCEKYLLSDLRDVPARLYWHVDEEQIAQDLFSEKREPSLAESAKQDSRIPLNINRYAETTTENTTTRGASFRDPLWDLQHGNDVQPTEQSIMAEETHKVALRLSAGLRRGEFPETLKAQSVYKWVIEREREGQSLDKFIAWAMDGKRAEFSFVYHKDPSLIKRDWMQVFTAHKSKTRGINNL